MQQEKYHRLLIRLSLISAYQEIVSFDQRQVCLRFFLCISNVIFQYGSGHDSRFNAVCRAYLLLLSTQ